MISVVSPLVWVITVVVLLGIIVLDLARVGSGAGPDVALIAELHAAFPELELLAGGGVRDVADLQALADAGAAGALVATALHSGAIGRKELRALG